VWGRHHVDVPVGVVDVGSNTVRLLVSENGRTVLSERAMLRLGADIERHGEIPEAKLAQTASVVAGFVADARAAGVEAIDDALEQLAVIPTAVLARRYGIGEERARTLPAGAVILAALQQRLGTPLKVQRGGLREGALLTLAAEHALAA
jgi:exopolyphosphatase/pppGpp-phosphohydrolase